MLEPTCGSGAFLAAAARTFPAVREFVGVEYQRERYGGALAALQRDDPRISIRFDDAYAVDFARLPWAGDGPLLIVGNPPWLTTAALGRSGAHVPQPPRSNPLRLRGLDARTGSGNFDVAEFLLLKLLSELASAAPLALAVLVKESVARKVVAAHTAAGGALQAEIVRIDARSWFGVSIDACCLIMTTQPAPSETMIPVRTRFDGEPVAWFDAGPQPPAPAGAIVWRQGIKHDAADIFELRDDGGIWRNGLGDVVDVESAYVFPLQKARAVQFGQSDRMALIVPQKRLNDPTAPLATHAPRLHAYFRSHRARLEARKSSIYRSAPPFAVFGIGPYSFAPWKVAVAGFYAEPNFRVLGPLDGRPVMLGDTSYFVGFEDENRARAFAAYGESDAVRRVLERRIVRGKRPITKRLLSEIDWGEFHVPRSESVQA